MTDLAFPLYEIETYVSLLTLTLMEIVLGIDNVVFLSILTGKLQKSEQPKARFIGLALAFGFRVILLLGISWIIGLTKPLFAVLGHEISGRDLILILGGLFLISKATSEIHGKVQGDEHENKNAPAPSFGSVVVQIALIDLVFSFDSVITAVGLVKHVPVMIAAVLVSMLIMLIFASRISDIIHRHPTIKMLALSFLLMIGTMLFAEGFHVHVEKGYIYFAMAFSIFVEMLNIKVRSKSMV